MAKTETNSQSATRVKDWRKAIDLEGSVSLGVEFLNIYHITY